MAKREQIEFIIRPDGTIEERVSGVAGPACEKLTGAVEGATGEIIAREHTAEFYKKQSARNRTRNSSKG